MVRYNLLKCGMLLRLSSVHTVPCSFPARSEMLHAMDENTSGVIWMCESVGRRTLSQFEDASRDVLLVKNFYNGFEMWWLAGMPITLVIVLALLSFSLDSGIFGLCKSMRWYEVLSTLPILRLVDWLSRPLCADVAVLENESDELKIPRHIAVIMDGNRRYGKTKYGAGVRGHSDGSRTLVNFTDWCIDAGIMVLTVFAFSTENWNREQSEVDALMNLFTEFMDEIVPGALKRGVRLRVLISDRRKMPVYITEAIQEIEAKTRHCSTFSLNLCVSYGARDEIVGACKKIATDVASGKATIEDINEDLLSQHMLTAGLPDPEVLLRTSGEIRISNFLLFQIAYSELIFLEKLWPDVIQEDVHNIIVEFNRRKRRFGK